MTELFDHILALIMIAEMMLSIVVYTLALVFK